MAGTLWILIFQDKYCFSSTFCDCWYFQYVTAGTSSICLLVVLLWHLLRTYSLCCHASVRQSKSCLFFFLPCQCHVVGIWGIGVATQKANLNQIPLGRDVHSLVMRNDGALYYNNEEKNRLPANSLPQEGDVVVSFFVLCYPPLLFLHFSHLQLCGQTDCFGQVIVRLVSHSLGECRYKLLLCLTGSAEWT